MKFKTILSLGILILLAMSVVAQTPTKSAFLIGPTNHGDAWALRLAYAAKIVDEWIVPFVDAGTSVEVGIEVVHLFDVTDLWAVGVVGALVGDFSNEPGTGDTSPRSYMTGAFGIASTYNFAFAKSFGLWGGVKFQSAFQKSEYDSGIIGGAGIFYRLQI